MYSFPHFVFKNTYSKETLCRDFLHGFYRKGNIHFEGKATFSILLQNYINSFNEIKSTPAYFLTTL